MSEFVTTTTETITKKTVNHVVNGGVPNGAYLSVVPVDDGWIRLTVGARREDGYMNRFSKVGLSQLIEVLQEIHEAME